MEPQVPVLINPVTGALTLLLEPIAECLLIPHWVSSFKLYYYAKAGKWKIIGSGYKYSTEGFVAYMTSDQIEREVKLTPEQMRKAEAHWVFKKLRGDSTTQPVDQYSVQYNYVN